MKTTLRRIGHIAAAMLALSALPLSSHAADPGMARGGWHDDATRADRGGWNEIARDRRELRQDYRELAQDRADYARARAAGDIAAMRRERMEIRRDLAEIGRDRAELRRDLRERHQDRHAGHTSSRATWNSRGNPPAHAWSRGDPTNRSAGFDHSRGQGARHAHWRASAQPAAGARPAGWPGARNPHPR